MRMQVMMIVAAGLLVGANHAEDKDQDKIQGTWKAVTVSRQGQTKDEDQDHHMVFEGDGFSIKQGDRVILKGTFKLDPAKDPKTIDLAITEGPQKDQTSQGIYALDGDKLKWVSAPPGKDDRPKDFTTKEGAPHMMVVFDREKK
ncbi:MAG TPA: TIGR03067 domain-containing protein [Isosphaeraceae bacterium]|jgi:uncharacterized protein (TIGR03067 family)|nr:TIGR03067 domain-containing protein [Isosphaeraceae bacterium]